MFNCKKDLTGCLCRGNALSGGVAVFSDFVLSPRGERDKGRAVDASRFMKN